MRNQRSILFRLRIALILFALTLAAGTIGYMILLDLNFVDALYFTVVTISTVGYGDIMPSGEGAHLFTTIFVLTGMGTVAYTTAVLVGAVVEGGILGELGHRKMEKQIEDTKNHIVLCGFGRIGSDMAASLVLESVPFVIIESDEAAVTRAEAAGHLVLRGDATCDDVLIKAGIQRARAIVPALASDADNLFIVMSARQLNPNLVIVARATDEAAAMKMWKAGADKTVRPLHIGAQHLSQAVLRPTVLDFIQVSGRASKHEYSIEEIPVAPAAGVVNQSLAEIEMRKKVGVILIGIKRVEGELVFNPSADTVIHAGDTLVAMGDEAQMDKLRLLVAQAESVA